MAAVIATFSGKMNLLRHSLDTVWDEITLFMERHVRAFAPGHNTPRSATNAETLRWRKG